MKGSVVKVLLGLLLGSLSLAQMAPTGSDAASWGTWIADADAIAAMVEAPTDADRERELLELIMLAEGRDDTAVKQISYWNAASPSYRWIEALVEPYSKGPPNPMIFRALALLNVAIYDTTVVTWKAKYAGEMAAMKNLSPSGLSDELVSLLPPSHSPSFPSEHAAVATVASEILSYLRGARNSPQGQQNGFEPRWRLLVAEVENDEQDVSQDGEEG